MRRVALVAAGAEGDAAAAWLDLLPDVAATRCPAIGDVAYAATDVVWVHGPAEARWEADLLGWLAGGGRLLATLGGARLLYDIGLEPVEPEIVPAPSTVAGLAGFGPHPLFAGPGHGLRWAEGFSASDQVRYRGRRPVAARVVAVAWERGGVDASCALAWEQRTGDGGVLCIGAGIALDAGEPAHQRFVRRTLANAITGDAVAHRDRAHPATTWPAVAAHDEAPRQEDAAPIPRVPDFAGEWPAATPLDPLTGEAAWRHAGRRLLLVGSSAGGLREAWAHPFRLMTDASLTFVDRAVLPVQVRAGPNGVERTLPVGAYTVTERLIAALELPLLVWDLAADGDVFFRAEWTVDFRLTAPYPANAGAPLVVNVSEGGRRAWVGASGSRQAVFAVDGGRIERIMRADGGVRLACTGTGRCRILCAGAEDDADLDRTLGLLARRGVAGLHRQRAQHLDQLRRFGLSFETPDPAVDAALRRAAVQVDAALLESPGTGRSIADTADPTHAAFTASAAVSVAEAALAGGNRELARDVVRFLRASSGPDGLAAERVTTSGLVTSDAGEGVAPGALVARWLAWTGDEHLAPGAAPMDPVDDLPPRPGDAGLVGRLAAPVRDDDPRGAAARVMLAASGLWGITPDAPSGLVRIRPAMPAAWATMAIRRLRVGTTQLEIEMRRRSDRFVARVRRVAGPPITVDLALADTPGWIVTLDDEPLGSGRARFEAAAHHEVVFHAAP